LNHNNMHDLATHAQSENRDAYMNTIAIEDKMISLFGRVKASDECEERAVAARRDAPDQDCTQLHEQDRYRVNTYIIYTLGHLSDSIASI
jgi:hypothetical protein